MSLSNDEYMAFDVSIAANSTIQFPVMLGVDSVEGTQDRLRVYASSTDVSFVYQGVKILASDGSTIVMQWGTSNPGTNEVTLVEASDGAFSGLLTITNRGGSAQTYRFGVETYYPS